MPVPPWDKNYDLRGLGPDLADIHQQPSRHVCLVVSLPLVRQHLVKNASSRFPEWHLRVDSTGHILCVDDIPS
eukprot:8166034-Alexandrium_andersonii.AAC.1